MSKNKKLLLPRVIFAATSSSAGKTTIASGIMLALRKRKFKVQAFKAGPDYIDPTYHTQITGKACHNLDTWLLNRQSILELFKMWAETADISIIEGVMGLYDGSGSSQKGSTADLAKILSSPVILIINAASLSRSAAAMALGFREFDKKLKLAGVILNNIGSKNHYRCIKRAIQSRTKIRVLGYLPKTDELKLPQRYLGLIPAQEKKLSLKRYTKLVNLIEKNINLNRILKISSRVKPLSFGEKNIFNLKPAKSRIRIAVACDKAFSFYYQNNLDILSGLGADLVEFNTLRDKNLPKDIAGVYIGGGFPELFASRLSKNTKLKEDIYKCFRVSMPIYAECGGLMYLVQNLIDSKKRAFPMVGIFKVSVVMADKLQALGYVNIETIKDNILSKKGAKIRAHVFHWSYLDHKLNELPFAYKIIKNKRIFYDALVKKNVLASYAHLHFASNLNLAKNFINNCWRHKRVDA